MTAPHDIVRVHQHDQTITFRVEERARMAQGLAVRRFAERGLAGGVTALRVDLRHCTFMDSTFLGTLLYLKRAIDRRGQGEFALVCPSPQCRGLLQQMGVADLFPVVPAEEPAALDWTELTCSAADAEAFRRNVVQAHQELASLPGPAGEPFREVARCLAQDLEAHQAR
jgi:anti-anti-sigma factor